jgi:hypothetical protein
VRAAPSSRTRSRWGRLRGLGRRLAATSALAVLAMTACGEPAGQVELAWRFVDADLDPPLFPGKQTDTCDLIGKRAGVEVPYDLGVLLRLTPESCVPGEACPEEVSARFSCKRARGVIVDVPAREERYVVQALVAVSPDDGQAYLASDDCVVRPGSRTRRMDAGGTLDLGVYQFLVAAIDPKRGLRNLDVEACFGEALEDTGDGTGGGAEDGGTP